MSIHDHEPWQDDLAAYALGALSDDELTVFEAHLRTCERCRTELRWLEPAVDALPASIEQLEPPPGLRKRLLDTVGPEADRPVGRDRDRARWHVGGLRPAFAAAATVVALIAGLAGGYALRGDDERPAVTATTTPIEPATPAIQANAALVRDGERWTLDVSDMPQPGSGDVYQVWIRHGDRVDPSVLFVPSRDERASVVLPASMATADELMVTREPSGGSNEPTSAPMLDAQLN
jgi:anti-sigma-K factor RskA